jgi:uncharacterized protein (DUF2164 family)
MPLPLRHLFALCLLLFAPGLHAAPGLVEPYAFPLHNPFEATIATTPPELRPPLPADDSIEQSDYRLNLQPARAQRLPQSFWAVRTLGYRLARQSDRAPLVFIIGGTGAHYSSSHTEYLKRLFYGAGYHVVQLSSPTSYDFMAAASRQATPGLSREDAEDLYRVMQAIRARHAELPVSHFLLAGYSLGALNAAFVSQLDEHRGAFGFRRVLMLNPPVNLHTSISNLDRLVQVRVEGVDDNTTFYELILGKLGRYFQQRGLVDLNAAMLYDFQQSRQRLSDEQMAMLIGAVFRFTASDIAFTSDLINQRGLITPPGLRLHDHSVLEPYFKRALLCDFDCYMEQQLFPAWQARYGAGSREEMIRQVSLHALQDYLTRSDKILVMHNADDLILGPGDLGFLRRTLGERLLLYPRGGHCGNLNYRDNARAMLEFFDE